MRNVVLIILFSTLTLFAFAQMPVEEGLASYYNRKFNGHRTSSGEIYRHTKLTAAHPNLPFGTDVLVTNLRNNKSVVVRINDRCSPRRIRIDLSRAAAERIDMLAAGVQKVRIEVASDSAKALFLAQEIAELENINSDSLVTSTVLKDSIASRVPIEDEDGSFSIQVATVASLKNAQRLSQKLGETYGLSTKYRKVKYRRKSCYKIYVGSFANKEDAADPLVDIKKTYRTAFIIAK